MEKLRRYAELYKELGGYPYDQDPARPGWNPLVPNSRWADPTDGRATIVSLTAKGRALEPTRSCRLTSGRAKLSMVVCET